MLCRGPTVEGACCLSLLYVYLFRFLDFTFIHVSEVSLTCSVVLISAVQQGGVRKSPWRPTPVFLPRESHGQRSLVGYSPWGRKSRSDTTWRLNNQSQVRKYIHSVPGVTLSTQVFEVQLHSTMRPPRKFHGKVILDLVELGLGSSPSSSIVLKELKGKFSKKGEGSV